MATQTKKKTTSTTASKKPVTKEVATETKTSKTTGKIAVEKPLKKTDAKTTKKTPVTPSAKKASVSAPVSKASAPKVEQILATAEKAPKKNLKKPSVTPEERYHMISTAAYFRAEQRNFAGGYEMQDWISSEAEIDTLLKTRK